MSAQRTFDTVHVVSHTHWDREWYEDFQGFRIRLVYLIDELLDLMEREPNYRYFLMDGQTIVLDDYLEIRGENRERLLKLIRDGRIGVGPWYVMPDEFLVSGESLIRNLLKGFRSARALGVEPVKSGYIPDIFGHNSQFPQILRGFGIDNAVLFRGFHGDADPSEIWWEGADGSRVLGLKLDEDRSYGDFYFFIRWPFAERDFVYEEEELVRRASEMLDYKEKRATTRLLLGLDGVDHIEVEPQLPWILKTLNEAPSLRGVKFEHSTLETYLSELRSRIGDLRVYRGEQRSPGYNGVNNWLLSNVLSSRIHLKQMNQRVELLLERWVEPWAVFAALEGRAYPYSFLQRAWEFLLQNHPHDSICGCSIDQVHSDMQYRFDQSRLIAEHMLDEQLQYLVQHIDATELQGSELFAVFNPSPLPVDEIVIVDVEMPRDANGGISQAVFGGAHMRLFDCDNREVPYQLVSIRQNSVRRFRKYRDIPGAEQVDRLRIAFRAHIPAYGYAAYSMAKERIPMPPFGQYSADPVQPNRLLGTMNRGSGIWENGKLRVLVQRDGTMDVTDLASGRTYGGLLIFEDEGDVGEGWNHVAPLVNQTYWSCGEVRSVVALTDGPLAALLCIERVFHVPVGVVPDESRRTDSTAEVRMKTYVELRRDDPMLRCRTVIDNTARNHRMKMLVPTHLQSDSYFTSTPFDLVERPFKAPDYPRHLEFARHDMPHNGLVLAKDDGGGLAVFAKGMYEVSARDDEAKTIAMTLFRGTRNEVLTDGGDGGQLLKELTFEFAFRPFGAESDAADLVEEQKRFAVGLRTAHTNRDKVRYGNPQRRERTLPKAHSYLHISAPGLALSALKRAEDEADAYIVRVWNPTDGIVEGDLSFGSRVQALSEVNLDEQDVGELEGFVPGSSKIRLSLRAKQIMTLKVKWSHS
ncbi:alpha-mannosidase [Cohnella nanjingensis]|uniref:Glycoside hydrolase family 38 central domain-containing protein n=1 Tax=Cohnella nanjingensis TaxID=1387779 RepID=A0A7X0VHW5_9BACL|nr:glycoside hydrolase family 38 C-terminal domain-containing protein [Cohnella nanjingensis]MBB6674572.1 hypothetical protein [Cohnella nanjingensis]